jgi:hypothetical protein
MSYSGNGPHRRLDFVERGHCGFRRALAGDVVEDVPLQVALALLGRPRLARRRRRRGARGKPVPLAGAVDGREDQRLRFDRLRPGDIRRDRPDDVGVAATIACQGEVGRPGKRGAERPRHGENAGVDEFERRGGEVMTPARGDLGLAHHHGAQVAIARGGRRDDMQKRGQPERRHHQGRSATQRNHTRPAKTRRDTPFCRLNLARALMEEET